MAIELTPELISSTWHPTEVVLSRDGRRVAWVARPYGYRGEHKESAVWVADTADLGSARRWTYGGADGSPRWSPDATQLAFTSDRKERGTAGLYLLPAGGGEARPLVVRKRDVGAFAWSPDGRRIAFVAPDDPDDEDEQREKDRDDADVWGDRLEYGRLHVVDVESGEVTDLPVDGRHAVALDWSPDGSSLAVVATPRPDDDGTQNAALWVLTPTGADAQRVCAAAWADTVAWSDDGRLVFVGPHGGTPTSSYTVFAAAAGADVDPQVIGPGSDDGHDGLAARVDPSAGTIAILVADGLGSRLEQVTSDGRAPWWDGDGQVDAFDVAGVLAVVQAADCGPDEVWAGPPDGLVRLSDHHADWARVEFGPVEDVAFTAPDGQDLDGILVRPVGGGRGAAPLVVLPHGGPYGRSGRDLHCHPLDWGQLLATAGFAVLYPNYRGGLGRGDAFARAARGDVGGPDWTDVLAGVDAMIERGVADPARLGIGGWSQGGFMTAWAVTHTDRFAAAVMGAGVSDWGMMSALSDLPTFESELGGSRPWDGPGPLRGAERSPLAYSAARTTPLLILHGQDDRRVPIGQATAFHRALRDQDAPVGMVTYPREPHGVGEYAHQVDLQRRVLAFFRRHLQSD